MRFFVDARNAALKENRYQAMHSTVTIQSAIGIRFRVRSTDTLVSPAHGIDESTEPMPEGLEIEVREGKPADAPAAVKQEFYFTSGKYAGQGVIALSGQYLTRLETVVDRVEQSIGQAPMNPSSGSAR